MRGSRGESRHRRFLHDQVDADADADADDAYAALIAPIVVEAATRLAAPGHARSGALPRAEALPRASCCAPCNGQALEVFGAGLV